MSEQRLRLLILGGYGTFGGRLAQLLAGDTRVTLLIAGRSLEKAEAFCRNLAAGAERKALRFDRERDVTAQIREIAPDAVVDATGPFQNYGPDPYRVIKAALALGIHYLDLADGSDFVKGVGQFDRAACERGIFILSGVSSVPALTAAVVRHLSRDMSRVDTITGGIAPSPYAGVGYNVIRAIAAYAGHRVALKRDGQPGFGYAMTETMRYTIAPPGRLPLHNLRFSLVDVPDLQALPELWPSVRSIWIGVAPVPEILHRMLNALAATVRWRVVPSLSPLAIVFYRVINILRWGEHRGGMFVAIGGTRLDGARIERSWHLLAEGDDGPLIPSMAALAIILRCLAGQKPAPGARPATRDLELADYDALFATRTIYTGSRDDSPEIENAPLYRQILGDAWMALPEPLRAMHDLHGDSEAEGIATVERGTGLLARAIAALFRFPVSGQQVPVKVTFLLRANGERWRRNFAGHAFASIQMRGTGRFDRLLVERFGPFAFALALVVEEGRLRLILRGWRFFGCPLPLALAPRSDAYESVEDGRFHFHVDIRHPLAGLIVGYRGWLVPRTH